MALETENNFSFQENLIIMWEDKLINFYKENKKTIWSLFNLSEVKKRKKRNLNFLSGGWFDFLWCVSHLQTIKNILRFLQLFPQNNKSEDTIRLSA